MSGLTNGTLFFLASLFFTATFITAIVGASLRRLHQHNAHDRLNKLGNLFFYRPFHLWLFPKRELEGLFFVSICAQTLFRFLFVASVTLLIFQSSVDYKGFLLLFSVVVLFVLGDFLPRTLGALYPDDSLRFLTPFASLFFFVAFPLSYPFLKIPPLLKRTGMFAQFLEGPQTNAEREILQVVRDEHITEVNPFEKKLIGSVLRFGSRVVREVMVPRVDVFSLNEEMSTKQALDLMVEEGYSRIPVYQNTVDNIVGVLMYKDLMNMLVDDEKQEILNQPISMFQKSVIYTPETKKISSLLQEFRKKQVHLAIVVDEYGGTEGIVTIEDILEEIVGEIADEYDIEEEMFLELPDGSYIVDARFSILDAEQQLDLKIPQAAEYDTIGGYIFHRAGSIPSRGFVIHHDEFELEILRSNERCVEKVRIRKQK
jgi:CBS domain containing-hemolysin-like protein